MEELKGTEAKLWVPLVREEMAGGGRSTAGRDAVAEALVGGGAPVVDGRREVVGKMREGETELLVRSIEGGERRRRGFDGEVELAGVRAERRRCSGVWGLGDGKRAKGTACWGLVVLMRARGESGGLCLGRATTTTR